MKTLNYFAVLFILSSLLFPGTPGFSKPTGDLVIFHAGSLSVPFKEVSAAFTEEYPGVKVFAEAAGSRACARKIADLGRPCDVMGSADYTVIDTLLIPDHADWNIKFAANEMTIVYHRESRMSAMINQENWHRVLLMGSVAFGRSNPDADPCGYRAVLTMKLAEKHYGIPGLAGMMLKKDLHNIRPKETDLLALLEAGEIDYIFLYRSVAEQHGLEYVLLPDEVNLKKTELTDLYKSVSVDISGKTPGSKVTKKGQPMVYGVTIPKSAPNPEAAHAYVNFLLSEKGMKIMEKNGQPALVPAVSSTYDRIPESLKKYALPEK